MSGYVKFFKGKINNLISFHIEDVKLLEECKTIWTKIEGLLK